MGNSVDSAVQLSYCIFKPYTLAGEIVEGIVYLNITETRRLKTITLQLSGKEKSLWARYYGHTVIVFSQNKDTYKSQFILKEFNSDTQPGLFAFPFSFLLSRQMPGTLIQSKYNKIQYLLRAILTYNDEVYKTQEITTNIIIQEPQRSLQPPINKSQIQSSCCNCCCSYGTTQLSLQLNSNTWTNGDSIAIKWRINNSQSLNALQNTSILLKIYQKRISYCSQMTYIQNQYSLLDIGTVAVGQDRFFNEFVQIPQQINTWTAVGNIIERFFTVQLTGSICCCSSNPSVQIPIVFNCTNINTQTKQMPQFWSALKSPLVIGQLCPYIYEPDQKITNQNRNGLAIDLNNKSYYGQNTAENQQYDSNLDYRYNNMKGNIYKNNYENNELFENIYEDTKNSQFSTRKDPLIINLQEYT